MIAIALGNKETIQTIWKFTQFKVSSTKNETVLHYAARHNNLKFVREGCKIKNKINIHQKSQSEQYTALHIAVQQANVGATRVLLANGALDEWKDRFGKRARDYISDGAIRKLFREHKMLPDKKLVKSPSKDKRPRFEPPQENDIVPTARPIHSRYILINQQSKVKSAYGYLYVDNRQRTSKRRCPNILLADSQIHF